MAGKKKKKKKKLTIAKCLYKKLTIYFKTNKEEFVQKGWPLAPQ
jgi:hypothetical protein